MTDADKLALIRSIVISAEIEASKIENISGSASIAWRTIGQLRQVLANDENKGSNLVTPYSDKEPAAWIVRWKSGGSAYFTEDEANRAAENVRRYADYCDAIVFPTYRLYNEQGKLIKIMEGLSQQITSQEG